MKPSSHLLSCDWGTSSFRLRLVNRRTLRVEAEHVTAEGAQPIAAAHCAKPKRRAAFAAVLQRGLVALGTEQRPDIPLVISGMACSTIGWYPLPYAKLPARLSGADYVQAQVRQAGREIRFISGLRTACDVLRGEECELTGLFASASRRALSDDCLTILPGTHSKHVRLRRGRISDFTTHPTGELFALLSRHSTLCGPSAASPSPVAFREGVQAARRLGLSAALFQTRARTVLGLIRPKHSLDFLSGVLIGAEIASLPSSGQIVLAASPGLSRKYEMALRMLLPARRIAVLPPTEVARSVAIGHAHLLSLS